MTELIVALDGQPGLATRTLISNLAKEGVQWFKVGVPMLLQPEALRTIDFIRLRGGKLMLDLKLYDTRDTVLRAVDAAVALGVDMLTVHLDCVVHLIDERRLKILAVRRLTDGTACWHDIALPKVDGVICSVAEARQMRPHTNKLLICPGIRPEGSPPHNHEGSAASPFRAREAGADFIVVGRPIIAAPDPVAAALAILKEMEEANHG